MRVLMRRRITGARDGAMWPDPGGVLDVPDHEAADLIAAGYAVAAERAVEADGPPATVEGRRR